MNTETQTHRSYAFVIGLAAGTVVGAGLAIWLVPRAAAELRDRVTDSAKRIGRQASEQYARASTQVGEAVGEVARKGRSVRDDVAGAVARGAHEVERYATTVEAG